MRAIRKLAHPLLRRVRALRRTVVNVAILTRRQGQFASIVHERPRDAGGRPLPWYTYPATEWLTQLDVSSCSVFEFGSGDSSAFWSARAARVVSVENDAAWYERVEISCRANQTLLLREDRADYVGALRDQAGVFDIIVIDGEWRDDCVAQALAKRAPGGIVVLDNSDWFPDAARALRAAGLLQIDFNGFGPGNGYCWTTSVFLEANTRLQAGFRDPRPVGGFVADVRRAA